MTECTESSASEFIIVHPSPWNGS